MPQLLTASRIHFVIAFSLVVLNTHAQVVLLDGAPTAEPGIRVGLVAGDGFIADHFKVGSAGETWVIDSVEIWAVPDTAPLRAKLGDLYEGVSLFGGIESPAPVPGEPVCDCHNLITVKTGIWHAGSDTPDTNDIEVSKMTSKLWQLTFRNLSWSVPGGVDIQFGVMGRGRPAPGGQRDRWYSRAAYGAGSHQLRVFDGKGKFEEAYSDKNGTPLNPDIGINVQVWGHKPASISIHKTGSFIEVVLKSDATLDSSKTDSATLRFGPRGAAPVSTQPRTINGRTEMILQFQPAETGISPATVSACLQGAQVDGTPFVGCDLVNSTDK